MENRLILHHLLNKMSFFIHLKCHLYYDFSFIYSNLFLGISFVSLKYLMVLSPALYPITDYTPESPMILLKYEKNHVVLLLKILEWLPITHSVKVKSHSRPSEAPSYLLLPDPHHLSELTSCYSLPCSLTTSQAGILSVP